MRESRRQPFSLRRWVLLLGLCASLGAALVAFQQPGALEPLRGTFLTIIFTVTTFSVMFSMGAFNSSAYRQFHRTLPHRFVWSCVGLLFLALLPLVILVMRPDVYVSICLIVLPLLMVAGAALLEIGRRETDPLTLLETLCSPAAISQHFQAIVPEIEQKIAETEALRLSQRGDRPSHEFSWHLPLSSQRDDPLTALATLGLLAIQHGDIHAFGRVVTRFLDAIQAVASMPIARDKKDGYQIKEALRDQVGDSFQRVTLALLRDKGTVSLARAAIDTLATFVANSTQGRKQTENIVFWSLSTMERLARHCYESGSTEEVRMPLIVARQIVQKGIDDPPVNLPEDRRTEFFEFVHRLPQLTNVMKRLGSYAIEQKDMNLLYRCFDAFGWLGCSAVKDQHRSVATACLRALSQLGREVRSKNLECFWDHCPVRPEAHAEERIDWMFTWVTTLPEEERKPWLDLIGCAYSRFSGKDTDLTIEQGPDGKPRLTKNTSGKKYVEGYAMHAGARDVDYSDFTFLKDLELHGGKGLLFMQGPIVPLSFSKTDANGETGAPV